MLTDSHIHLYMEEFEQEIEVLIRKALNKNIGKFLLPNIDNKSLPKLLSTCNKYKEICYPMIGLHPCSVNNHYNQNLYKLYQQIDKHPFIGVGEVGIDLHWGNDFFEQQKDAFEKQINWANKHKLPLVIHSRKAFNEVYEILYQQKDEKITGIFHCFTGTYEQAKKIIDLGFYLGIGGIITFKNNNLTDLVKKIDLKHIVLETDAPYLAPHPMRGKQNKPEFLSIIAQTVCDIKNVDLQDLTKITNQNINNIFINNAIH